MPQSIILFDPTNPPPTTMEHTLIHVRNLNVTARFDDEHIGARDFVSIAEGSKLNINLNINPAANIAQNYRQLREFVDLGLARVDANGNTVTVLHNLPAVSPSAASVMASGQPGSGWRLWRLKDGRLLDDLRGGNNRRDREEPIRNRPHPTHPGSTTFPNLVYNYGTLPPLNRQTFTVGSMKTIMINNHLGAYTSDIPANPNGEDMQRFEYLIKEEIRRLLNEGTKAADESYISVFHKIQLWGGVAGRNIYVRNGGFDENFTLSAYKEIVKDVASIDSIESFDARIPALVGTCRQIHHWGPAFATKHFKFISSAAGGFLLPIYDSVIARGLYGIDAANWDNYQRYVHDIHNFAVQQNSSVEIVERVLFNHFSL
jgi:hypothetical protein